MSDTLGHSVSYGNPTSFYESPVIAVTPRIKGVTAMNYHAGKPTSRVKSASGIRRYIQQQPIGLR
jgi:hypothetical protein